ncbi:MAG: 3'-5' exonuclease [Candidatus Methanomethyliaceae archaeon]|nr:3'-5' exonuclease [Candidatus Methanomethyliaceae archaeon]MDW7970636.1 3'-5' exonuclease [Nitrososphaerota archaeon]
MYKKNDRLERNIESDIEKAEFSVIDLETTGLDVKRDDIISIAIIPMTGLKIHFKKYYYTLIRPSKFSEKSIKIHGICPGDLNQAPRFEEIYEKIMEMLNNKIIVGFNVDFDIAFLREKFKKIEKKIDLNYVDIKKIESWILIRRGTPKPIIELSDLISRYGIEEGAQHNALVDAYTIARIFQNQLKTLLTFNIKLNDLLKLGRKNDFFN